VEEARIVAEEMGCEVVSAYDVGVAGIHRLFTHLRDIIAVMHHNELIRMYYASVKKRTGSGKLAHVSTMRKLTRMLYHMLKTKQHWKWENPRLTERKMARLQRGGGDGS